MDNFAGSVAIVTGAASGIGLALARAAQARGCALVMADIRPNALEAAAASLAIGGNVLAVPTDVADADAVEALAQAAIDRFGKVNLLFNNAGVYAAKLAWEMSRAEYDWVIDVNQRSVVNGIRSCVPRMIAQGDPCHVVTVSSGAGIIVNPGTCAYAMTKHAVLALSEALYLDLAVEGVTNIGVTVAMPGFTQSDIMNPAKARPGAVAKDDSRSRAVAAFEAYMQGGVAAGLSAEALAEEVFGAIVRGDLHVLPAFTDEASQGMAQAIAQGRISARNPYPPIVDNLNSLLRSTAE
ncbi:SDR family NAD(P)-dependent oxidoreductase [soil metagenome]